MSKSLEENAQYVAEFGRANTVIEDGEHELGFNGEPPGYVSYADIDRHGSMTNAIIALKAEQNL